MGLPQFVYFVYSFIALDDSSLPLLGVVVVGATIEQSGKVSMCINSHNVRVPLSSERSVVNRCSCARLLTNMFRNRNLRSEAKLSEVKRISEKEREKEKKNVIHIETKSAVRAFLHFSIYYVTECFSLLFFFSFFLVFF